MITQGRMEGSIGELKDLGNRGKREQCEVACTPQDLLNTLFLQRVLKHPLPVTPFLISISKKSIQKAPKVSE